MGSEDFWVEKTDPLIQRDMSMREVLERRGILNDTYHKEIEKVHIENGKKIKALIDKNGFPVLSNAGEKAVRQTWLIIHHSISLPDFMRECLMQMRLAAAEHDYPMELLAYTEDLVAYLEGRKQLYGTNLEWVDGELKPSPIEDHELLAKRRKSMGLPLVPVTLTHERPPKDPEKKKKDFEAWLKQVGWRL